MRGRGSSIYPSNLNPDEPHHAIPPGRAGHHKAHGQSTPAELLGGSSRSPGKTWPFGCETAREDRRLGSRPVAAVGGLSLGEGAIRHPVFSAGMLAVLSGNAGRPWNEDYVSESIT